MPIQRMVSDPSALAIAWSLVHFLWQGALVALIVAIALRSLRNSSANARYLAACAGLALMALMPLATFLSMETPPGQTAPAAAAVVAAPMPASPTAQPAVLPPAPVPAADGAPLAANPGNEIVAAPHGRRWAAPLVPAESAEFAPEAPSLAATVVSSPPRTPLTLTLRNAVQPFIPWCLVFYIAGVVVLSLRLTAGWLKVQMLKRSSAHSVGARLQEKAARICRLLRISRPVRLLESAAAEVPIVIGALKPVILLPASALTGLTPAQLEAVIAHELAHVRRYDYLVNLVQTVIEVLLFYHPCVWWLTNRIRAERENCCDDLAVGVCRDRMLYARALAQLEEARTPKGEIAMASAGGVLLARIRRLLVPNAPCRERLAVWLAAPLLVAAVAVGAFFALPRAAAQNSPQEPKALEQPAKSSVIEAGPATLGDILAAAKPGDTVLLEEGDYGPTIDISSLNGAEDRPIVIRARGDAAVSVGAKTVLTLSGSRWVIIDRLKCATVKLTSCQDCVVTGCALQSDEINGLIIEGSSKITVQNCDIFKNKRSGFMVGTSRDITIRGNTFRDNGATGMTIKTENSGGVPVTGLLIENNTFTGNVGAALNLCNVWDSMIRNNLFYNGGRGGITLFQAEPDNTNRNNSIIANTVYYSPDQGNYCLKFEGGCLNTVVRNNIFYGARYGTIQPTLDSLESLDMDYNLIGTYQDAPLLGEQYADGSEGYVYTIEFWKNDRGFDRHSVFQQDPKFVSVEKNDYRLAPDSPAVGVGADISSLAQADKDGAPRLAGVPCDLGCYAATPPVGVAGPSKTVTFPFSLTVLDDATGAPLKDVDVEITAGTAKGVAKLQGDRFTTEITVPSPLYSFTAQVSKSGYVPMLLAWIDPKGVTVPPEYTLRMKKGTKISGLARTLDGKPLADAAALVSLPGVTGVERPALDGYPLKTDADGRFECDIIPADAARIYVAVKHPDYTPQDPKFEPDVAVLRSGDAVFVMRPKYRLSGTIVAHDGSPAGAVVKVFNPQDSYRSAIRTMTTEKDGSFSIADTGLASVVLTVTAGDCAPYMMELAISQDMGPLSIQLDKASVLRGRVVNAAGEPLQDVSVHIESWGGRRTLTWSARTAADGRFQWTEAPPTPVTLGFSKEGFISKGYIVSAAPEEESFLLPPNPTVSGKVTDAVTGAPIERFRVTPGDNPTSSGNVYWRNEGSVEGSNGAYDMPPQFKTNWAGGMEGAFLRAEGRNYRPLMKPVQLGDTHIEVDFALERAEGITGIVRHSDGTLATDATAVLSLSSSNIWIGDMDLSRSDYPTSHTDAKGEFWFPAQSEPFAIAVVSDREYAEVSREDLKKSPEITLKPFGRIEGAVLSGPFTGAPEPRVTIYVPRTYRAGEARIEWHYTSTIDKSGAFKFERVIPGLVTVSRETLIPMGGGSFRTFNPETVHVEVKPNETARVELGLPGRKVKGRYVLPPVKDSAADLPESSLVLVPMPPDEAIAARVKKSGADDLDTILHSWRSTPEGKAFSLGKHGYSARFNVDGSFAFDNVLPGTYALTANIYIPSATVDPRPAIKIVTVTDESPDTVDVGALRPKKTGPPAPGDAVPDLSVKTVDGKEVTLASLKGKFVILYFWSTQVRGSRAGAAALTAACPKLTADGRLTILGLTTDSTETIAVFAAKNPLPFAQAPVGDLKDFAFAVDCGIDGVPYAVLLSPDGVILASRADVSGVIEAAFDALAGRIPSPAPPDKSAAPAPVVGVRSGPAKAPAPSPTTAVPRDRLLVAVLDDADPDFRGKANYNDTLTLYDENGKALWQIGGLNTCQTVGAAHGVSCNAAGDSLSFVELVSDCLTSVNISGKSLWVKTDIGAHSTACDPKTGNLWCLTSEGTIYGNDLRVFDAAGNPVANYSVQGFDIAYSRFDDTFVITGRETLKMDRNGKVLWRSPQVAWVTVSACVDNTDGAVFITEGIHPQVGGSQSRILVYEPDGRLRREIPVKDLGSSYLASAVVDSARSCIWTGGAKTLKLDMTGKVLTTVDIPSFSLAVDESTGNVWLAGHEGIYKLDPDGKTLWFEATPGGSQKWLCLIPARK